MTNTNKVIIYWRNTVTGETGNGTEPMSIEDAAIQCRRMNKEWPNILHWFRPELIMAHKREKKPSLRDQAFKQGFVCACMVMLKEHGESTMVEDCLRNGFKSVEDLRLHKVDENDIEALMPIIKELERKQSLTTQ